MSYTSQQFLLFDNSSNANFQNWAGTIDAAIQAMGWTLTSDTGQTNPASAAVPAAGSFIYRVYQPADALQTGSTAYYLRVDYGTGSGSPAGPRIRMQIGTGTDGAGNLTGVTVTRMEPNNTNVVGQGSTTFDCYFSGDIDRLGMMLWRSLASQSAPLIFAIERTKNTDGTNSSDGVNFVVLSNSSSANLGAPQLQQTLVFGIGATSTTNRTYIAFTDGNNTSGAFNNNVPVSPLFPQYGKYGNPITVLATVHTQDVAEGCFFTTSLYGATRTYLTTVSVSMTPLNMKICLRYD